jgi:hypothetical protein
MEGAFQNPMSGENKKEKIIFPIDFKVIIITGGGEEEDLEVEQLFSLKSYCEDEKIPCKIRQFDTDNENDATLIQKIPVVFVQGKRGEVMEVVYPDEKLVDHVKKHTMRCKLIYEEKKQKQQEWNKRVESIKKIFWSTKKPVLQKK